MARDAKDGRNKRVPYMDYKTWYDKYVDKAFKDGDITENKMYNINISLGKFGIVCANHNININWNIFNIHGNQKLEKRNIEKSDIENWIKTGIPVEQIKGSKYAFVTKEGVAIIRIDGKLITAWSSEDYDKSMKDIIKKLFGDD